MKRLHVFWRENKGAPFVEMRFGPCLFLQAHFSPVVQVYLRGTMEDGIFLKWKKKRIIWGQIISLQLALVHCCYIPILSHYVLFSHCPAAWLKEKSPVGLITTLSPLQLLKNGSNLGFGKKARWGTNEAPRLACSRAVLSSDLDSFVVCRRGEEWMVWIALGYISERPQCRGVGRSKDLFTN